MAASAPVLHWVVTYFFCSLSIVICICSDFFFKHRLSLIQISDPVQLAQFNSSDTDPNAYLPHVFLDREPYVKEHPFQFVVLAHGFVSLLFPLYIAAAVLRKVFRIPRYKTIRKRLKTSRVRAFVFIAHITEQFDDCMVEGRADSPSSPLGLVGLGLCGYLWTLYQYFWHRTTQYVSVPFASSLQHLFLLLLPPLMVLVLHEKIHGLKYLATLLSYIGVYLHFFPQDSFTYVHPSGDVMLALVIGISGVLCFGCYLVYYRLLNPDGWMVRVLGLQALAGFVFSGTTLLFFSICGLEYMHLPHNSRDWQMLVDYSVFSALILFCVNQALRWGEPLAIASALTVVQPLLYFIQAQFFGGSHMRWGNVWALILVLMGYLIISVFHFSRAMRGCTMLSTKASPYRASATPGERRRLILGAEYIL